MRRSRRLPHPLQTLTTTLIDACHMHVLSMAIYYTLASNSKRAERAWEPSAAGHAASCANTHRRLWNNDTIDRINVCHHTSFGRAQWGLGSPRGAWRKERARSPLRRVFVRFA
jgi:hypothetical protein